MDLLGDKPTKRERRKDTEITQIFLAMFPRIDQHEQTLGQWDWVNKPLNILVTFPYVRFWLENSRGMTPRATILDSGAYSAWKGGIEIDFDALCEEAKKPCWDEVVALDVIGDAQKSLENSLKMRDRVLTVMPVFHFGEPWEILQEYKKNFLRIGLSCRFGEPKKDSFRWLDQCFSRAYPHRFHSFGWVARDMLLQYPFVTADTSSWATGTRYGRSTLMPGLSIAKKSEV